MTKNSPHGRGASTSTTTPATSAASATSNPAAASGSVASRSPASASAKGGRSRLGRGLSSLMQVTPRQAETADRPAAGPASPPADGPPSRSTEPASKDAAHTSAARDFAGDGQLREVDPALIDPNPHQPRKDMPPAALSDLAASLKVNGVIQPLVVRPAADGRFQLIAGERRLRAAKVARLPSVPVIIREADSIEQAQLALVENIQREDLNPIDRAEAYRDLLKRLGLSQSELAGRMGEDRSSVANHLRLLELSPPVKDLVRQGRLTMGHGKVLAGVGEETEQLRLAELALKQNLSVRNLERLVAGEEAAPGESSRGAPTDEQDSRQRYLTQLAETVGRQVGSKCTVTATGRSGYKLTLHLKSAEQFDRVMERLGVELE